MQLEPTRRRFNKLCFFPAVLAIFLAIENPKAVGQVYNLTDGDRVTKRKFFETIADGLGLPRPSGRVPLFLARLAARFMERRARRRGANEAPRLTQARLKFLGLNLDFRIEKAKADILAVDVYLQTGARARRIQAWGGEYPPTPEEDEE